MRTMWKYALNMTDDQVVMMPRGASVLSFQIQNEVPTIWSLVDSDQPTVSRRVIIVGTGHDASDTNGMFYVGTAQFGGGSLVLHLFVEAEPHGSAIHPGS